MLFVLRQLRQLVRFERLVMLGMLLLGLVLDQKEEEDGDWHPGPPHMDEYDCMPAPCQPPPGSRHNGLARGNPSSRPVTITSPPT